MVDDVYFSQLQDRHLYDGLEEDICIGEQLLLRGPSGDIEILMSGPKGGYRSGMPVAIVCHPHPLYGGSLKNKVVHMLTETFNEMGLVTVAFNFRGVGRSQGRYDHGRGETDDLAAVAEWLKSRYPEAPLWLAGFSFGAYVAARGHREIGAERLLLVAPPVTLFDFSEVPPIEVPWMVIQGGRDEIIEPHRVSTWVHGQQNRPSFRWMADADHFFHGRMNRLRDSIKNIWSEPLIHG